MIFKTAVSSATCGAAQLPDEAARAEQPLWRLAGLVFKERKAPVLDAGAPDPG